MDAGVFRALLCRVLPDRQALYAGHGEVIIARDWAETARASRSKKVVIISFLMAQI